MNVEFIQRTGIASVHSQHIEFIQHTGIASVSIPMLRRPALLLSSSLSSTIFKHLLLRNRLANQSQIYVEPPWEGGTKVCINGPGHMTKMAATPIYGKNL